MSWLKFFKRGYWDAERARELEGHLQIETDENIARGMTPDDARYAAMRKLGNPALIREEIYHMNSIAWLESLWQDLRYGARLLRRNPGFAFVAILSLALGIGANTAIFQLLDAVRLRTLPVQNPQELALVQLADRKGWRGSQATRYPALTNPIWERFRDTQSAFAGVLAWGNNQFNLASGGEVHLVRGLFVNGEFFRVLGVQPLMGRVFTAADDHRGCGLPGTVISYAFWQRELGGESSAIGRKIRLNDRPVEIIGVTPAAFTGLEIGRSYDVAVPICSQTALWTEGNWLDKGTVWWLSVLGRLKPGEALKEANAHLRATSSSIFEATLPKNYPAVNVKDYLAFKLAAIPAANGVSWLRSQYEDPLLLLLATAGLVLLIACANLANLMLARATARERELAVRLAIGASRGRLMRQLMAESLLLAITGAGLGLLLAGGLGQFLVALLGTQGNSLFVDLQPDWRVLGFTAALACLTCLLFGLTPAWQATRTAPGEAMKTAGRGLTARRERFGLRRALIVSQVALSLVLLLGALLFSRTLRNLMAVDAGFQQHGLLVTGVDYRRLNIPVARRIAFKRDLMEQVRSVPGVDSAAEVDILPLSGGSTTNNVWIDGSDPAGKFESHFNWISGGYLRTMGMPLVAGRDFNERDTDASPKVAIVNQLFARRLGLGDNPVGKRFRREATPGSPETVYEITGLVKNTKYNNLREEFVPVAFLSTDQEDPGSGAQILVRSGAPLADLTLRIRSTVARISPAIDVDFEPYDLTIQEGLLRERLMATLSGFFGALAALLATMGLYGVISYMVVCRTGEIGIRMALGADRRRILLLILREAGTLLGIGLAIGAALALVAGRAAAALLFGLKPHDGPTLALAVGVLAAVALAASYVPARRAARLDPMVALREE